MSYIFHPQFEAAMWGAVDALQPAKDYEKITADEEYAMAELAHTYCAISNIAD